MTAQQAAARGRRHARSDVYAGTSRRSCSAAVRTATGPDRWRRCRSSPTRTRGRGRASIKQRTAHPRQGRGAMPPWYIEKNIGIQQYKNDPSLSDEEIAKIAQVGRQRRAARQPRRHAGRRQSSRTARTWTHRQARPDRREPGDHREGERARLVGRASSRPRFRSPKIAT